MMPDMDGIETVRRLREAGYTRPIVALTANAVAGQADVFLQNGFDGFISKPIDIYHLNDILNQFVRGAHPEEAAAAENPQKLIFIVDDDDDDLSASASALGSEYRVMTVLSVQKMLKLMEKKKPDAILTGLSLPEPDGAGRLDGNPEWKDIPVIPLGKPVDPERLPCLVKQYIQ
jgi:CheY-like chemotaxis protein